MPRRAAADLAVLSPVKTFERLRPPADLTDSQREIFIDLVAATESSHFRSSDLPLLTAYVRSIAMERQAAGRLDDEGYVNAEGRPSPWLAVLAQACKNMAMLSMRLRLSPQGRSPTNPKREPAISAYERISLQGGLK
jgi:hypothetical protein